MSIILSGCCRFRKRNKFVAYYGFIMCHLSVKILHILILSFTGIALIGVNVSQFYCGHCDDMSANVQLFSVDEPDSAVGACCCEGDGECDGSSCGVPVRHHFYKINDFLQTERSLGVAPALDMDIWCHRMLPVLSFPVLVDINVPYWYKPPLLLLSEEHLCVYRC